MQIETTEEGLALHSLGLLDSEQVPNLALLFLDEGCQALEMAALAGAGAAEHPADLRAELVRAVHAAGRVIPDRVTAAKVLRRAYARRAVSGLMPLRETVKAIIRVFREVEGELPAGQYVGESFGIERLVGDYYSYDDVAVDDRKAIAEIDQVLRAALGELAEPSIDERIRELEEQLLVREIRASSAELDRLVSNEFIEFGSSGRIYDKSAIIAALTNDPGLSSAVVPIDFRVLTLAPGVALATYRLAGSLRSSIWRLENGSWRILFHQGTPTP